MILIRVAGKDGTGILRAYVVIRDGDEISYSQTEADGKTVCRTSLRGESRAFEVRAGNAPSSPGRLGSPSRHGEDVEGVTRGRQ